jgi:hypothetical protein
MTPGVPYGDHFTPHVRYCITWTGPQSCKVFVSSRIHFIKNPLLSIVKRTLITESSKSVARGVEERIKIARMIIDGMAKPASKQHQQRNVAKAKVREVPVINEKYKLPNGVSPPSKSISCHCAEHLQKKEQELVLDMPAKQLFETLFETCPENNAMFKQYHNLRKETDRKVTEWESPVPKSALLMGEPAHAIAYKSVKFKMPLNVPIG